jgi:thiol-disulfide isomerase/thioredoxin
MKNSITLLLLTLMVFSCKDEKSKEVYFKNGTTGKVLTKIEYKEVKDGLFKKMSGLSDKVTINEIFTDSINSNDSIIKVYKLNVNIGSPKETEKKEKEKIYSFLNKTVPSKILTTQNGEKIDLSKISKPTVLNFWFTSCKPCIDEMPILNKIKSKYQNQVDFIAITHEEKDKTVPFFKKHKFDYKQIIGEKEFVEQLGIQAFPKNIFIDKNGIIKIIENGIPYIAKNGKMKMGEGKEFENNIQKIL